MVYSYSVASETRGAGARLEQRPLVARVHHTGQDPALCMRQSGARRDCDAACLVGGVGSRFPGHDLQGLRANGGQPHLIQASAREDRSTNYTGRCQGP